MMQGDSYGILVEIQDENGVGITPEDVSDVEITIGHVSKTYSAGQISYSGENWVFPITQEESFKFPNAYIPVQIRVARPSGDVIGVDIDDILVEESISKVVL